MTLYCATYLLKTFLGKRLAMTMWAPTSLLIPDAAERVKRRISALLLRAYLSNKCEIAKSDPKINWNDVFDQFFGFRIFTFGTTIELPGAELLSPARMGVCGVGATRATAGDGHGMDEAYLRAFRLTGP